MQGGDSAAADVAERLRFESFYPTLPAGCIYRPLLAVYGCDGIFLKAAYGANGVYYRVVPGPEATRCACGGGMGHDDAAFNLTSLGNVESAARSSSRAAEKTCIERSREP
jgi:hypothetical protein